MLVYESLLELDRLWLADFDPTVTGMSTQPFQVSGRDGTTQRSHVPDVLLVHADRQVTLVDVKPAALLEKPAVRAQFAWTRRLCQVKGWSYEVFTGGDATVLRNIRTLALGRRPERLPQGLVDQARASLASGEATLGEALARKPLGCEEGSWQVAILACLWAGHSVADLRQPLSATTVLHPTTEVAA